MDAHAEGPRPMGRGCRQRRARQGQGVRTGDVDEAEHERRAVEAIAVQ